VVHSIDVGSRLFLASAPDLAVGLQFSPGDWRRRIESWILARRGQDGGLLWQSEATHAVLELAWETVRLREYPERPSRFDCIFLWASEDAARHWHYRREVLGGIVAGLYEVEVVTCERVFLADLNLISYFEDAETIATLMARARRYWHGDGADRQPEVLLDGGVVVRRNLLALSSEALEAVQDSALDQATRTAVRWTGADGEQMWSLQAPRLGRYTLHAGLTASADLPRGVAGWIALEVRGRAELALARLPTAPVLVRSGQTHQFTAVFDLAPLPAGVFCRPVLICDRAAAHYWQLQPYWEGRLEGEWQAHRAGLPTSSASSDRVRNRT
jgi:Protein of unknown function (DUF2441)